MATREETAEHIKVEQAFVDGKQIESALCRSNNRVWDKQERPEWDWSNYIYRIHDPYRKLKEAAADPTKEVWVIHHGPAYKSTFFSWNLPPEGYEIRDKKPKTKKGKLLAWRSHYGAVVYAIEGSRDADMYNNSGMWVRLPSEDKEIEVPE